LAAVLDALPLLVQLRARDAPPACAELAEALPRAARLRELVVGCKEAVNQIKVGEGSARFPDCRVRACRNS
jgi:hypothetical protein